MWWWWSMMVSCLPYSTPPRHHFWQHREAAQLELSPSLYQWSSHLEQPLPPCGVHTGPEIHTHTITQIIRRDKTFLLNSPSPSVSYRSVLPPVDILYSNLRAVFCFAIMIMKTHVFLESSKATCHTRNTTNRLLQLKGCVINFEVKTRLTTISHPGTPAWAANVENLKTLFVPCQ